MNAVGRIGSYIYRGVGTVSGPFHPFGGAIDIIVVQQPDGSFKSSPWYVRFGKFQGVLKNKRNLIKIEVNGVESSFNMYLAHTGQAYFLRESDDVIGDSETAEVYNLSSGDEGDGDGADDDDDKVKLPFKSKSCNYDCPSKPGILGFVFGGRSVRESKVEDGVVGSEEKMVDSDLILETPLVASPTLRYLDEKEQDFRESNNVDDYCEENAILVDNGSTSTVFSIASEGSGEVDVCLESAEPLAQDSTQEMLSVPESVENVAADQVDLWSIGTSQEGSSTGSLVQDESKTTTGESQSTSVLQPEMEEEQFSFCDLDDCKPAESCSGGSNSPHTVKVDGKEISPANSKVLSEAVDIERKNDVSGEEVERLVESLPIMRLHDSDDMDASPCQPMSQSFDPCSNTSKWDLREDVSSSRSLDAESVAESSPNIKAFTHVIANPDVVELSFCKHLLRERMGAEAASQAFNSEKLDMETFAALGPSVLENDKLILKIGGCYFPWEAAAPIILGVVSFGTAQVFEPKGMIAVDQNEKPGDASSTPEGGSWKLWPFSLRKSKNDNEVSSKDAGEPEEKQQEKPLPRPVKKMVRALAPTSEQLASLDLKEGMNTVNFTFSTNIVDARIYLWKWNARIVISDVDGTITRSDVLGQFMPLVGIDWSQTGVTHLFSAVKENGYQLMFLSARAISQASITRQFLVNLKQDGKALPDGPVVISPDGVFPSLYREVIRRAPHEFKISCLAEIRALFPPEHNPFYAGFGNRNTDEISYLEVGIPRGKIFTINPKGQVAVNRRVDTRSYTNLHALVNGMFPATTTSSEREDFNTWNFWKLPPPSFM